MKKGILTTAVALLVRVAIMAQTTVYTIDKNKVSEFAGEVYLECQQYMTEGHLKMYAEKLSKVELIQYSNPENLPQYPLLTSIPLNWKCNLDMVRDDASNFSPEKFNPLKYFFHFYAKEDLYYRVDGTNYVIRIKAN